MRGLLTPRLALSVPGHVYAKLGTRVDTQLMVFDNVQEDGETDHAALPDLETALHLIDENDPDPPSVTAVSAQDHLPERRRQSEVSAPRKPRASKPSTAIARSNASAPLQFTGLDVPRENAPVCIANVMLDLDFMLIGNEFKTEEMHPDNRIEVSSHLGILIRVGSARKPKSNRTGKDYISLLINTPDGDLRVNAVQNEEQRGGQAFSIIPFVESAVQDQYSGDGLALVAQDTCEDTSKIEQERSAGKLTKWEPRKRGSLICWVS